MNSKFEFCYLIFASKSTYVISSLSEFAENGDNVNLLVDCNPIFLQ